MFTKLLVPLDGSPLAEQALGHAVAIARASKAAIDLLHVQTPFPFRGFAGAPWEAVHWGVARTYLDSVAAEVAKDPSVAVTHETVRGEAISSICGRIADSRPDLVVMTSHGRTGLSRAWMGSVADGVVRYSSVPVLVLRPMEEKRWPYASPRPFKRMLVPLDGSPWSSEILTTATALAKCSDALVVLLRIAEPVPAGEPVGESRFDYVPPAANEVGAQLVIAEMRDELEKTAVRLREATGLAVESHVVAESRVAPTILEFARTQNADLIAMATHGRGMSRFLMGCITDKLLRGSGLPMLLYRPLAVQGRDLLPARSAEAQSPVLAVSG